MRGLFESYLQHPHVFTAALVGGAFMGILHAKALALMGVPLKRLRSEVAWWETPGSWFVRRDIFCGFVNRVKTYSGVHIWNIDADFSGNTQPDVGWTGGLAFLEIVGFWVYQAVFRPDTISLIDGKVSSTAFGLHDAYTHCEEKMRGRCLRRPLKMLSNNTIHNMSKWLQYENHSITACSLQTDAPWVLLRRLALNTPVLNISLFGEELPHVRSAVLRGVDPFSVSVE